MQVSRNGSLTGYLVLPQTSIMRPITPEEYDAAVRHSPTCCPLYMFGDRRSGRQLLEDADRDFDLLLSDHDDDMFEIAVNRLVAQIQKLRLQHGSGDAAAVAVPAAAPEAASRSPQALGCAAAGGSRGRLGSQDPGVWPAPEKQAPPPCVHPAGQEAAASLDPPLDPLRAGLKRRPGLSPRRTEAEAAVPWAKLAVEEWPLTPLRRWWAVGIRPGDLGAVLNPLPPRIAALLRRAHDLVQRLACRRVLGLAGGGGGRIAHGGPGGGPGEPTVGGETAAMWAAQEDAGFLRAEFDGATGARAGPVLLNRRAAAQLGVAHGDLEAALAAGEASLPLLPMDFLACLISDLRSADGDRACRFLRVSAASPGPDGCRSRRGLLVRSVRVRSFDGAGRVTAVRRLRTAGPV